MGMRENVASFSLSLYSNCQIIFVLPFMERLDYNFTNGKMAFVTVKRAFVTVKRAFVTVKRAFGMVPMVKINHCWADIVTIWGGEIHSFQIISLDLTTPLACRIVHL